MSLKMWAETLTIPSVALSKTSRSLSFLPVETGMFPHTHNVHYSISYTQISVYLWLGHLFRKNFFFHYLPSGKMAPCHLP